MEVNKNQKEDFIMVSRKIYEDIISVKEQINEGVIDDILHVCTEDYFRNVGKILKLNNIPIRTRLALLTVLGSGTFVDGKCNPWFNMPPTSACCENYKITKRELKHRYTTVFLWSEFNERYEEWRITSKQQCRLVNSKTKYKKSKHNKSYLHK